MNPYIAHSKTADQSAIENARGVVEAAVGAQTTAGGGEAPHRFSASYEARKRALVAEVARQTTSARGESATPRGRFTRVSPAVKTSWKIAATVAAVCVALPMGAYAAANHAELFGAMFGNEAREDYPAQPYVMDKGDGETTTVVVPSKEFVDVDPQKAEDLVGAAVADAPQTIKAGNAEITITSVVRSENQAIVSFVLKDDPDNPTLIWDKHSNATKGARFADASRLYWGYMPSTEVGPEVAKAAGIDMGKLGLNQEDALFPDSSEGAMEEHSQYGGTPVIATNSIGNCLYVDPEKSTDDTLYCYDYLVFPGGIPADEDIVFSVLWGNEAWVHSSYDAIMRGETPEGSLESIVLKTPSIAESRQLSAEGERRMTVSPLGLVFNVMQMMGADEEDRAAGDPGNVSKLVLNYKDGTDYVVWDAATDVENSMDALSSHDSSLGIAFNRLVDPMEVESVEVTTRDGEVVTYR